MVPSLDTTKYAIIYPRQSTDEQTQQNVYSTENQLRLKFRALADGFPEENVLVIDDDLGVSGRTIDKRVGMKRALSMITQGLVGALYAEDQTRLSRDIHSVDQMEIAKRCRIAKVPLFMGGSWRDLDDWGTRVAYKVEAVISSEMWGLHQQKMQEAERTKARKGQWVARPPRGYRKNTSVKRDHPGFHKLVVHEPEAEIILALAHRLLEVGSLNKLYRDTHPMFWPDGKAITYDAMREMFRGAAYRGVAYWGEVWVENAHPPILPPDLQLSIDRLLDTNRTTLRRPSRSPSRGELSGLIYCANCKRKVYTGKSGDRGVYRCEKRDLRPLDTYGGYDIAVSCQPVDEAVTKDLWNRLLRGKLPQAVVAHLEQQRTVAMATSDIDQKQAKILERKRDGFVTTLSDPDLEPAVRNMITTQLGQVIRDLEAMQRTTPKVRNLDAELDKAKRYLDLEHIHQVRATWDLLSLQDKRIFLQDWIERVLVTRRTDGVLLEIEYRGGETGSVFVRRRYSVRTGRQPAWTKEEDAVLTALLADPERPDWGWPRWVEERMWPHGFRRSRAAISSRARALELLSKEAP